MEDKKCKTCKFFDNDVDKSHLPHHGWCHHPDNKIPPSEFFPEGMHKSKAGYFVCDGNFYERNPEVDIYGYPKENQ